MRISGRGQGWGRGLATIVIVAVLAGPALAVEQNDSCPGTISASSLQPVPATATYDVENYGNPDNPLALRTKFLKWLTRAGFKSASPPTYMFSFKAEVSQPSRTVAQGRHPEEDSSSFRGATYSTIDTSNWLFGLDRLPRIRAGGGSGDDVQLHINVQLRNQQGGRVVWFADVFCSLQTDDRAELIEAISKPLIAQLGRTARQVPF
jgi:hypothetical protein